MTRYMIPMGENGRIILPQELRRVLGVEKGSRIVIEARDDRVELTTAERMRRQARERYRELFPDRGRSVVDAFLTEKREEARREGDYEPAPRSEADGETTGATGGARSSDAPE